MTFPSPEQMVQCNLSSRFTPRHSMGTGREHSLRPGKRLYVAAVRAFGQQPPITVDVPTVKLLEPLLNCAFIPQIFTNLSD
ncbi:hypothetical protein F2P79_010911 [Pimephales promelas]|nr:hypothetical protein F2P79_010911 [Pimephales promelas]